MALIRRFWSDFLAQYKGQICLIAVLMLASVALQFPTPLITMYIIDGAVESQDFQLVTRLALLLAGLVVIRHGIVFWNDTLTLKLREKIIFDVESRLVGHLQLLPMSFYSAQQSGYLQSRVLNDARAIEGALVRTVLTVVMDALTFLVGAVVVLFIAWKMGVVLLGTVLVFLFVRYYANDKMRLLSRDMQEYYAQASASLAETFVGIRATKSMVREEHRQGLVQEKLARLQDIYVRTNAFGILSSVGASFVTAISVAFVLWYGLQRVLQGTMTIGEVVGVLTVMNFLYNPVNSFVSANLSIQSASAALQRTYELLSLPTENQDGEAIEAAEGKIEVRDVSFGFGDEPNVLEGIDLSLDAGEVVALVGRSGVGKSTLVNLLLRFYEPRSGRILLDGRDIQTLSLADLRNTIGLADQNTFLFTGTILENIRLARPEATLEEVRQAARASFAHDFISQLPSGYDTQVGERGMCLSMGQCQRIALARLFLRDPPVLVLDEAVSAVDSEAEEEIQAALQGLVEGRTVILIAHRLSSLMLAERVVLIDDGRVVEDGSHAELMAVDGAYRRLFQQQFKPQTTSGPRRMAVG